MLRRQYNFSLVSMMPPPSLTTPKPKNTNRNGKARSRQLYADSQLHGYPWSTYSVGFLHLFFYTVGAVCSYVSLVFLLPPIPHHPAVLACCGILGWSMYCLWMIGHECYHLTMAPSKFLNKVIAFLSMDCLVNSEETWHVTHKLHHHHTLASDPEQDRQRLFGSCILIETTSILYTILIYCASDIGYFLQNPSFSKASALVIRFILYTSLPTNIFLSFVFFLAMWSNYAALLTHAIPVFPKEKAKRSAGSTTTSTSSTTTIPTKHELHVLHQLRTSIDIFPQSPFCLFLFGGLNCHCVHHLIPSLPRSLHSSATRNIAKLYPEEYRHVKNMSELMALFILRSETFATPVLIEDLPKILRECGLLKILKKISMDVGSLFVMATVVHFAPPISIVKGAMMAQY